MLTIEERTNVLIGEGQLSEREAWFAILQLLRDGECVSFQDCFEKLRKRLFQPVLGSIWEAVKKALVESKPADFVNWRIALCERKLR